MTAESLLTEINDGISDIAGHLENISDALWNNPQSTFVTRVSHVLTCDMFDQDKLNCIRVLYLQMAWPEKPLTSEQTQLLERIK